MKVAISEATAPSNRISPGCWMVQRSAQQAGFDAPYVPAEDLYRCGCDVELISLHHTTDAIALARLPRRSDAIRIVGGHALHPDNIRPMLPYGDVFCIGEGEQWIVAALQKLSAGGKPSDLADLPGTIVPDIWDGTDPGRNVVDPLPRHPPYYNASSTPGHASTWYIEMSRGCRSQCHYCELGWNWPHRRHDEQFLLQSLERIDQSRTRRVSLFAPDEASHPAYPRLVQRIHDLGLHTHFGSMRLDRLSRKHWPFKANMLARTGIDGLTEETRKRVRKGLSDATIIRYFREMIGRGHVLFKVMQMFAYPWEAPADFQQWEKLWDEVDRIPVRVNVSVRFKWTALVPQPGTPLAACEPAFSPAMFWRIKEWHERVKKPRRRRPGLFVACDGITGQRLHALHVALARGGLESEEILREPPAWALGDLAGWLPDAKRHA